MKSLLERLFPSLGKKIAFAVFLVLVLAGSVFVYFAHRTGYRMLETQSQIKAHGLATVITGVHSRVMLEGKSDNIRQALESVMANPDIIDAFILRNDGSVALQAKKTDPAEKFPIEQFIKIPGTDGERYMSSQENDSLFEYVISPIANRVECNRCHDANISRLGYFAMKISLSDIRASALQHRTMNIAMTILIFGGLGIIIFIALSLLVIRPIGTLHLHIRQIESGIGQLASGEKTRFPLLREPEGRDEIADLCRDFNNLVSRLNSAYTELSEMHLTQLAQADRLASTGQMAAGIAHEIKNPIAGVLGALQVFDGEVEDTDPRKEILAEMMVQLDRVNHAVNDLLSFARPAPPTFENVVLNDIVEKTVTLLSQQIKGKHISLETAAPPQEIVISADRKQIQQVLWNVALNAIQAMEKGGRLKISLGQDDAHAALIAISDTGQGISPDQLPNIFKPFFTTKHKGTGLGMTISRRIIEQHNGSVSIESTVGHGTIVTIRLPQHQIHIEEVCAAKQF